METLKVGAAYPMAFETFDDITEELPELIDDAPPAFCARLHQSRAIRGVTCPACG
jgi:hypothetical protein